LEEEQEKRKRIQKSTFWNSGKWARQQQQEEEEEEEEEEEAVANPESITSQQPQIQQCRFSR
jgi:hypothetical protein